MEGSHIGSIEVMRTIENRENHGIHPPVLMNNLLTKQLVHGPTGNQNSQSPGEPVASDIQVLASEGCHKMFSVWPVQSMKSCHISSHRKIKKVTKTCHRCFTMFWISWPKKQQQHRSKLDWIFCKSFLFINNGTCGERVCKKCFY